VALISLVGTFNEIPGFALAHSIASKLICAAQLSDCEQSVDFPLVRAYGDEVAVLVRRYAPDLRYEKGMTALPVDFRRCRSTACGDGPPSGLVLGSNTGEQPTAFVHMVRRDANLYLQYWLYYADSATLRGVPLAGAEGFHADDWESFQVRLGAGGRGVDARASSHNGYNGTKTVANWASDLGSGVATDVVEGIGLREDGGWTHSRGKTFISGGSHAGHVSGGDLWDRIRPYRWTPASRVRLVPIEHLARSCSLHQFAIAAPWCKRVYVDPEYDGTD